MIDIVELEKKYEIGSNGKNGNGHLPVNLQELPLLDLETKFGEYQLTPGHIYWLTQRILAEVRKSKADISIFRGQEIELRRLSGGIIKGGFGFCGEIRPLLENYSNQIKQKAENYREARVCRQKYKRLVLPLGRSLDLKEKLDLEKLLKGEEYDCFKDGSRQVGESDLVVLEDILNQFCKAPDSVLEENKELADAVVVLNIIYGLQKSQVSSLIGVTFKNYRLRNKLS